LLIVVIAFFNYLDSQRWQGGVGSLIRAFCMLLGRSSTLIELRVGGSLLLCAHLHRSATTTRKDRDINEWLNLRSLNKKLAYGDCESNTDGELLKEPILVAIASLLGAVP
jgi:hypothetical protein